MKNVLLTLVILVIVSISCFAQTTKDYYVKWSPSVASDSVSYYEVYLQTQATNSGWALIDGADWTAGIQTYYKVNIPHIVGKTTDYSYTVNLPLSGGWAVAAIIANNGIRSVLGVSPATKLSKKPGKPTNVRIDTNP